MKLAARLDRPGLALAIIALAWLSTAGAIGLLEPTETRYAEIAREMRASGDYLVPHLNGIPHFHKPPLAYWMTALGLGALGVNAWGARIPATLAGIAALALVVPIVRRRFPSLGIRSGHAVWIAGTLPLAFFLARSVATDPWLSLAIALFWALAPSPWAIAALGLGFFAKGPVVLVPTVLVVLAVAALARDRALLRLVGPPRGWALFAAIALPWYLVIVARTPGLVEYLFRNQLYERYATEVHHRPGPPWYFVAVLIAGSLPWSAALVAGIARLIGVARRGAPSGAAGPARGEALLLLGWLLVPLVFFSFSGSKLPAYILPILPAAGLIACVGLAGAGRVVRGFTAGLLAVLAIAGWVLGPKGFGHLAAGPGATGQLPLAAHVAFACLLYAATWVLRSRPAPAALLVTLALTSLSVALVPFESPLGSPRLITRLLAEQRQGREPVVEYLRFNAGVPFYLGETVRMLDVPRETGFVDPKLHPAIFVTRDSLVALAGRYPRVWIIGPREASPALADSLGLRYQQTAIWRKQALGFVSR